jgi:hypothetical protein
MSKNVDNTKYEQILKSLDAQGLLNNWKSKGKVTKELNALRHFDIRNVLQRATNLKPLNDKTQYGGGMSNAWIFSAKIPGSNCVISFVKTHVQVKKPGKFKLGKFEILRSSEWVYNVVLDNGLIYVSDWKIYSLVEAITRFKFWVDYLTNVKCQFC